MPFTVKKIKGIDTSNLEKLGGSVVDLAKYTEDEFSQVASALQGTDPNPIWNKPLPKPRRGTTVYADGTNWNPGQGEGPYWFDGTNYHPMGQGAVMPTGAWTTFAPTITSSSGAFTTVSAAGSFLQIGKMVSFICSITITAVGTAAGNIFMTLPVGTLKRAWATSGVETALTGKTLNVFGAAAASSLQINQGNNSGASVITNGYVLTFSGTYEAA
jgi:hypothetical protein